MVVILIGLITFILGCVITYYLDHGGKKEPEKSNLELKEEAIRARKTLQDLHRNLSRLLETAVRVSVDEALGKTAANGAAVDDTQRAELYNRSYEKIKRNWSRMTVQVAGAKENGESASAVRSGAVPEELDEGINLPDRLDFEKPRIVPEAPSATARPAEPAAPAPEGESEDFEEQDIQDLDELEEEETEAAQNELDSEDSSR
jgi:hypothetical protein